MLQPKAKSKNSYNYLLLKQAKDEISKLYGLFFILFTSSEQNFLLSLYL